MLDSVSPNSQRMGLKNELAEDEGYMNVSVLLSPVTVGNSIFDLFDAKILDPTSRRR